MKRQRTNLLSVVILITFVLNLVLIVSCFLPFEIYRIESNSMEDTILPGDIILIKKTKCGKDSSSINEESINKNKNLKTKIVIFTSPENESKKLIKRIIGFPGDTLIIQSNTIIVNGDSMEETNKINHFCTLYCSDASKALIFLDSIKSPLQYGIGDKKFIHCNMTNSQIDKILHSSYIDSISINDSLSVFKFIKNDSLTDQKCIIVPKSGMSIRLSKGDYKIYENSIRLYEMKDTMEITGAINSDSSYTFKRNYYFVLSDNRHGSIDSRTFGFIPEHLILGRAIIILSSKDKNGIIWPRVLNKIM